MITTSDPEYAATKRIKWGVDRLIGPLDELARWIASTWSVAVLNVIYDRANSLRGPRLQVILEYSHDEQSFRSDVNFDKAKQSAIAEKFMEIIARDDAQRFDVDGLFVVFSAFAPLAIEEADSRITQAEIEMLKREVANPDLWEISRCFGRVTFFFYTDDQVKRYAAKGKKTEYAAMYVDVLKPYDEFGYLEKEDFSVNFDSKLNFDKNYHGNWFNYHR